ncbi:MAG TPA: nucleotide pyrophosphatase/phosphodiesterase family protein, partial [Phycisphaeraceae bacterium]
MAHPTAVINVVGLDTALLEAAPRLRQRAAGGRLVRLKPVLPAVTCPVQASMLTGLAPSGHGVVANGWYHRELAEVHFWKQSNRLVRGQKVWEAARLRDPSITCANLFWWFNMYSTVDYSVTPRPIYTADGRKIPDCYSQPAELRDELQAKLGQFPLFRFWGPASDITSSRWIARAAQHVHAKYRPTLMLVYLPHLDYALQKLGPMHGAIPRAVAEVDEVASELLDYLDEQRVRVIVVSEYGIEPVDGAVMVNRVLRDAGLLRVRRERGRELLDAGASSAFAVADHQVAHVYVKEARDIERVASLCAGIAGVEQVLDRRAQKGQGIDHERSGELVLVAQQGRWF